MQEYRDNLFDVGTILKVDGRDNLLSLSITFKFLDTRYTSLDSGEYFAFIKEYLERSLLTEKLLKEVKENLIFQIKRTLENPDRLLYNSMMSELSLSDPYFKRHIVDDFEMIESITLKEIQDAYSGLLKNNRVDLFVDGRLNDESRKQIEELYRALCPENDTRIDYESEKRELKQIYDRQWELPIRQSQLIMLYQTPFSKDSEDYFYWLITDLFLGKVPCSLLFEEVREKNSLCYSIYANEMKDENITYISTALDDSDKDKAIELIKKQVERIRQLDFDPKDFESAKKLLRANLLAESDYVRSYIDNRYFSLISNRDLSIDRYLSCLDKMDLKKLQEIVSQYEYKGLFYLKGSSNE